MNYKKILATGIIGLTIAAGSMSIAYAQNLPYKVQNGDTYFILSNKYNVSMDSLMKANNASSKSVLYPGQNIIIPINNQTVHTVKVGETYWTISKKYSIDFYKLLENNDANEKSELSVGDIVLIPLKSTQQQYINHTITSTDSFWTLSKKYNVDINELMKVNNANQNTVLIDGQTVKIPVKTGSTTTPAPKPTPAPTPTPTKPYITYTTYKVLRGDNFWNIAEKVGLPAEELMKANNMSESSVLNVGTTLKVPVHHIPVKSTPGAKYGELLDWWTEAQYVIPRGSTFEVVDFYTGKSFFAKRTAGAFHADTETLTAADSKKMKEIWGGEFSWTRRPVIIKIDGRKIAASVSAMPHAGADNVKGGVWTDWRSDDYGAGINHDYIKGNGIDGHFDIHFLNSTRHKDGRLDTAHQANIKISAGVSK